MSSKPRSDAKLLNLLPHQQDQIVVWLTEGVGEMKSTRQADVIEQIWEEWGIQTSAAALTNFWRRVVAPRRLRQAAEQAGELVAVAGDSGIAFEGGSLELLRQKTFEVLADPTTDAGDLKVFYRLLLDSQKVGIKQRELALQDRRVSLLEEQAAKAKEALNKVVSKGGLTPETLKQIEEAASLL